MSTSLPPLHSQVLRKKREFQLYPLAQLLAVPKPTWLLDQVLETNSLSVMYGSPGCGKTFLALDIALSVASGRPWAGRDTKQGYVLYVGAEGYISLAERVRTWCAFYKVEPPTNMLVAINPVDLMGGWASLNEFLTQAAGGAETTRSEFDHEEGFTDVIEDMPLRLVVIDTWARCITGGDENSAMDMGKAVQWVDMLRDPDLTGGEASVLVVHHTGKFAQFERGSSALRGAADTMLHVKKDMQGPVLSCSKQRNAVEFNPITFTIAELPSGGAVIVPRQDVRVFTREEPKAQGGIQKSIKDYPIGDRQLVALRAFASFPRGTSVTLSMVQSAMGGNAVDMARLMKVKDALEERELIIKVARREYIVTEAGYEAVSAPTSTRVRDDDPSLHPEFQG